MMILTLVIELIAVFPQLAALLLGSSWSTPLAVCFVPPQCLFHFPPLGAYFIPLPLMLASRSSANITLLLINTNFWFVWIYSL